jgi:hypothetical protein
MTAAKSPRSVEILMAERKRNINRYSAIVLDTGRDAKRSRQMLKLTTGKMHTVRTVGELADLLDKLPRDMPLHRHGNMGDQPPGITFLLRLLAVAKEDPTYFADIEHDPLWSLPAQRRGFGKAIKSLCTF